MNVFQVYHNRCFRCRICKRNLTGYSLNEDGDDIYCGSQLNHFFLKRYIFFQLDCYRRKQRGDCDTLEFHRAAAEKAQYVHNRHHPDQQNSSSNARPPSLRDVARHPSLTLRQLERQFLSFQPPNNNQHDVSQRSFSSSYHPSTINNSFSTPANLIKYRHDSTLTKDEPSPHFSPVFSPFPTIRSETIIKPRVIQQSNEISINDETSPTGKNTTGGIEFRLNKSNIDLTNVTSPQTNRKSIIIPDLNQNIETKESKFHFPDYIRRRSSSANQRINSLRVD